MDLDGKKHEVFETLREIPVVPELDHETDLDFIVSSFDEVLLPLIEQHDVMVIAGAYFGDEAKGKTTDAVARSPLIDLVARYNSGENAGHTVYEGGKKYVFHLTPSGVLIPNKQCAIGPECVMDPVNFMEKEIAQLVEGNVEYKDRLTVGNVHVVTPYHKILDFVVNPSNSSTLKGMSPVHASKVWKKGLRLDDLFNSASEQAAALRRDMKLYNALLRKEGLEEAKILHRFYALTERGKEIPQHVLSFLEVSGIENKIDFLIEAYREHVKDNPAFPQRADIPSVTNAILEKGGKIVIECPQSYWLSNAIMQHWRSSTSAQTHASGVVASSGINISKYRITTINVAKTPADSRVGLGANPSSFVSQTYFSDQGVDSIREMKDVCLDFKAIQRQYFASILENGVLEETIWSDKTGDYYISEAMAIATAREFGEFGATTGKPRITGVFDCLAARQVAIAQGPYLSLSALDRGDHMDKVGVTVAYVYHHPSGKRTDCNGHVYENGDIIRIGDPYPSDRVLYHCHPIIKVMDSWRDSPIAQREPNSKEPLPDTLQKFIGTIEDLTGFNVISIGNGKETNNVIYIKRSE